MVRSRVRRMGRKGWAAAPLVVIFCLWAYGSPSSAQAAPGDRFLAGMAKKSYSDPDRKVWSGDGPRPLTAIVWYPAGEGGKKVDLVIGPADRPTFLAGSAYAGAPFADSGAGAKYPLVVLSHGTGGSALQMAWLGTALARRGFIAAALNHHGNTGAEARYDARGFMLWWERAKDLSVLIDRFLADSEIGPRIDRDRIAAAGFSLGGYTVLSAAGAITDYRAYWEGFCTSAERDFTCEPQAEMPEAREEFRRLAEMDPVVRKSLAVAGNSYADRRIRAVAAIAPALGRAFTPQSLKAIEKPVLVIFGDADTVAPPATNGRYISAMIPGARVMTVAKAGHYTFLSECTPYGRAAAGVLCADGPGVSRTSVHDRAGAAVAEFFREKLQNP